jgi:hypothetical protein
MKRLQILFVMVLFASPAFTQQMAAYNEAGPVPPAITSAKTIFVSNAGSDSGLFPEPFTGDDDRAYSEFYAALKATGDYTLVADPSQADLVLELRLAAPSGPSKPSKPNGAADPVPQFKLVVYERQTHYVLWIFTRGIEPALLQKTHDKNFDAALAAILRQFLQIAGKAPAGPPAAPPSQTP